MSLFFDPDKSLYIATAIETLTTVKKSRNCSDRELYASNPLDVSSQYFDDREKSDLLNCINTSKLRTAIQDLYSQDLSKLKEIWIVITCGGFCPIHLSHIDLGYGALNAITDKTSVGMMVYYIPNNVQYTIDKLTRRGEEIPGYITREDIIGCAESAFANKPKFDLCTLDLNRKSWCEWFVCVSELANMLRFLWNYNVAFDKEIPHALKLKFAFVGGEDLVRSKNGLYNGCDFVDFIDRIFVVPRDVAIEKRVNYPLSDDIRILMMRDATLSSTTVRRLLKEKKFEELEKVLHLNTLAYLIERNMLVNKLKM